ncbi:unnamed protein product [Cochlearia groenlandica]
MVKLSFSNFKVRKKKQLCHLWNIDVGWLKLVIDPCSIMSGIVWIFRAAWLSMVVSTRVVDDVWEFADGTRRVTVEVCRVTVNACWGKIGTSRFAVDVQVVAGSPQYDAVCVLRIAVNVGRDMLGTWLTVI